MADSQEKVKRDWKEIVAASQGSMVLCPEKFLEEIKVWLAKQAVFQKEVNRIAKLEIETNVALQNVILKVRDYLEETGRSDIWTCDVGFQGEALKEGVHIITIEKTK